MLVKTIKTSGIFDLFFLFITNNSSLMKLIFTIKSLGKKRPFLNKIDISIDIESDTNLRELLGKIVLQQVKEFNERKSSSNLIQFMNESTIKDNADTGSVKFNDQYNLTEADEVKAIETVLLAFEDGLIAFFLNDNQLENLDTSIQLNDDDNISIIRLSFLSGAIW